MTGARLSFGLAGDTTGNLAVIGTISFKAGAGLFVDVGASVGVQAGTLGDLSGQHETVTLAAADGPGGSMSTSLDARGAPSVQQGVAGGPKLGVGAAATVDFSSTGVKTLIGNKQKTKEPSGEESTDGERGTLSDADLPHNLSLDKVLRN